MVKLEEFMSSINPYGRGNIQDFISRSQDISDILTYLQAELSLEMARVMSCVTTNFVDFERRAVFVFNPNQAPGQSQH